jgi:hypothetical protein
VRVDIRVIVLWCVKHRDGVSVYYISYIVLARKTL